MGQVRCEGHMRYIIAGAAAVLLNCTLVYSQQTDTAVKRSAPPQTTIVVQSEAFGLQTPGNISNRPLPSLDQLGNQIGDFVFMNGAAYMRLGGSLFPISGGGASGCFSVDLPQRIQRIDEFIRHVEDREPLTQQDEHRRSTSRREQPLAKIL